MVTNSVGLEKLEKIQRFQKYKTYRKGNKNMAGKGTRECIISAKIQKHYNFFKF